jgi:hypothetical protein
MVLWLGFYNFALVGNHYGVLVGVHYSFLVGSHYGVMASRRWKSRSIPGQTDEFVRFNSDKVSCLLSSFFVAIQ